MDCNQVFMILTRGPFPTGEPWDEDVESHLETCADCWRLAEALRPALEVFQEAIPPAESRELPGYWGDARPASHVVADLARQSARTALATGARPVCMSPHRAERTTVRRLTSNVWRALGLAATVIAAGMALLLLARG